MGGKLNRFERIVVGLSVGGGALFVVALLWWRFASDRWVYRDAFELSELIIRTAESYRTKHGHVPREEEMNMELKKFGHALSEQCPCYEPRGDASYIVWFGYETVGSSMVYRSESKKWRPEG